MAVNENTTNKNYPLPHEDNNMKDDVARVRQSLSQIDTDMDTVEQSIAAVAQSVADVDNTPDADKPISTATRAELDRIEAIANDALNLAVLGLG